jgi:hypothetical protein
MILWWLMTTKFSNTEEIFSLTELDKSASGVNKLWSCSYIYLLLAFVNKAYWNTVSSSHLCTVYYGSHNIILEFSSCYWNHVAYKTLTICYIAQYKNKFSHIWSTAQNGILPIWKRWSISKIIRECYLECHNTDPRIIRLVFWQSFAHYI